MDGRRGRGRGRGIGGQANPPPPPPPDAMNGIYQCLRELTTLVQQQGGNNHHNGGVHPLVQVPGNGDENRRMVALREFLRQHPPTFQGSSNPLDADIWIRMVRKICGGMGIAEDLRVDLATYLLEGEADHWWDSVKRIRNTDALNWEEFDQIFQDKYFLDSVRDRMKTDFLALRHGNMTVAEYEKRFDELSRYATEFISTEASRAKRFEQGLRPVIREKLVALKIREYGDLVDRAVIVERDMEDTQRRQSFAKGGPIRTGAGSSEVQRAAPYRRPD